MSGIFFWSRWVASEGFGSSFASADSDGIDDFRYKDFAIAKFARLSGRDDSIKTIVQLVVGDDDIEFDFGDKVEGVCASSECAGLALLSSKSACFENAHTEDAATGEGVLDGFEFVKANVGLHALHVANMILTGIRS